MSGVCSKRYFQRTWYLLSSFFVLLIFLFAVTLVVLRLFGYKMFTVTSGSMEPSYPVGSIIFTTPVDTNTLQTGDVITFMNDVSTIVTHRIAKISNEGTLRFYTKGDANNTLDSKPVHYKNIIGKPMVTIPFLGFVAYYLQRPPGIYISLIVCTFLISLIIIPYLIKFKRKENTAEAKV